MAGHSKFKNIMHRKGAQDSKRAKIFTKLVREIYVAAKTGDKDPSMNPRLRLAILSAKAANMPKDRIEAAIKKADQGAEGENFFEIRYEGYGPDGIAFIVEALTSNKNRTAGEVRSAFTKAGGALGETGSVGYLFERVGQIVYPSTVMVADTMMELAIEIGALDCVADEEHYEVITSVEDFMGIREALVKALHQEPLSAELIFKPSTTTEVGLETAQKLQRLVDVLEDNDDVQNIYHNYSISEDTANILDK